MRNKRMKQFIAGALAVGMIMTVPMTTEAATVTKQTTISPLCEYSYSSEISKEGAIYVELDAAEDYITNVKVRNKNLIAKVTRRDGYYSKYGDNNESKSDKYTAVIGLYAKKELTTKGSFDIYGKDHSIILIFKVFPKRLGRVIKVTSSPLSHHSLINGVLSI